MSLFQLGRICMKVAGRDAGKKCVVIKNEGQFVVIDGETRRRKVNVRHLEPLSTTVDIKEDANASEVKKALEPLGISVTETKAKKVAARPRQVRKTKAKLSSEAATPKKEAVKKKASKKKATTTKAKAPKASKETKEEAKPEAKVEN